MRVRARACVRVRARARTSGKYKLGGSPCVCDEVGILHISFLFLSICVFVFLHECARAVFISRLPPVAADPLEEEVDVHLMRGA